MFLAFLGGRFQRILGIAALRNTQCIKEGAAENETDYLGF